MYDVDKRQKYVRTSLITDGGKCSENKTNRLFERFWLLSLSCFDQIPFEFCSSSSGVPFCPVRIFPNTSSIFEQFVNIYIYIYIWNTDELFYILFYFNIQRVGSIFAFHLQTISVPKNRVQVVKIRRRYKHDTVQRAMTQRERIVMCTTSLTPNANLFPSIIFVFQRLRRILSLRAYVCRLVPAYAIFVSHGSGCEVRFTIGTVYLRTFLNATIDHIVKNGKTIR